MGPDLNTALNQLLQAVQAITNWALRIEIALWIQIALLFIIAIIGIGILMQLQLMTTLFTQSQRHEIPARTQQPQPPPYSVR